MANRSAARALVKMNRASKIIALIPKSRGKSDDESSSHNSEDETHQKILQDPCHDGHSSRDSSPAPSLPSDIEKINISDSDDCDYREVVTVATVHEPPISNQSLPSITMVPDSPSILADQDILCQASDSVYIAPSPSVASNVSLNVLTPPMRSIRSKNSRKVRIVVRKRLVKPVRLAPKWSNQKFQAKVDIAERVFDTLEQEKPAIEYFKLFFSDNIIKLIVEQTNLYSVQKNGFSINVTTDDIKDFLAINILMGIVNMPAYTDYWSQEFRFDKIANIMPLKKFQMIRRYLHFNDSSLDDGDRYYKIRPLVELVRKNCLSIEEGNKFSIDEMMVPYKGTRAGSRRQYIKNKPKKWGFKIFVRAAPTGLIHDFILYGGDDTFRMHSFTDTENSMGLGAKTVLALASTIQHKPCSVLYFDNFFTSIELIHYLREEFGIFSLGTIRQNRLRGAEKKLPTDKVLKKKGRGAFAQTVCNKNKIAVVKWFDNKFVLAASSYVDAYPVENIARYKKDEKKKGPVQCPNIIKHYNSNMGGVDLADMLVALYRTNLKGHRWYLPIFSQILDICVNNSWLLYRRNLGNKTKLLTLKRFRYLLYKQLIRVGRYPEDLSRSAFDKPVKKIKNPVVERADDATRYDLVGHFPTFTSKGRCRNCSNSQTKYYCQKCNARLCIVEGRNCFLDFHTK